MAHGLATPDDEGFVGAVREPPLRGLWHLEGCHYEPRRLFLEEIPGNFSGQGKAQQANRHPLNKIGKAKKIWRNDGVQFPAYVYDNVIIVGIVDLSKIARIMI